MLPQHSQELSGLVFISRKDFCQILVAQVPRDGFADYLAKVGGEREVAAFVELRLIEPRPASVDFSAFHRTAENEHDVGVAVVGAAVSVFAHGAAKLRHADDDGIFAEIAKVGPEGRERLREFSKHVGELAFGCAFVDVMVPSTDVGESNLHAEIGLNQLSELAQTVAESSLG